MRRLLTVPVAFAVLTACTAHQPPAPVARHAAWGGTSAEWAELAALMAADTTTTTTTTEAPTTAPTSSEPAPTGVNAVNPAAAPSNHEDTSPPAGGGQTGTASWYSTVEMGTVTASGEPLDDDALTAAHRTLPFGTRLSVCHDGCVTVRVTDRGPWSGARILDLSRAAFAAIANLGAGVIDVTWSVV